MELRTFGEVFSSLRIKKGVTLKETAEGIVSVQFLRRFEKGESDIKLTNFYELLNRINVSFEEFMFEYEGDTVDKTIEMLERKLDHYLFEKNTFKFRHLIESLDDSYLRTKNKCYLYFSFVVQSMYNEFFLDDTYKPETKELESYLLNCETWGKYEFFLASYSNFLYSNETLIVLAEQSFRRKIKSRSTFHYFVDFYLQVCQRLIKRNDYDAADALLKKYEHEDEIQPILQYLSFNVFAAYLRGLLQVHNGDPAGKDTCESIFRFFNQTVHYHGYANGLHQFYLRVYMDSPLAEQNINS